MGRDGGGSDGRGSSRRASFTGLFVLLAASTMVFAAFTSAFVVRRGLSRRLDQHRRSRRSSSSIPAILLASSVVLDFSRRALKKATAASSTCGGRSATGAGYSLPGRPGVGVAAFEGRRRFRFHQSQQFVFYVLTASHAFHLLGGVTALLYVDVQALRLRLGPAKRTAIDVSRDFLAFSGWALGVPDGSILRLGVMDVDACQRRCRDGVLGRRGSPYATNSKKFGMWLFIISDALTFSALLFAYTYSRVCQPGLAQAVPLLSEHHFLEHHDLLPALEQLDDGHGGPRR